MTERICAAPECERAPIARGFCPTHYSRERKAGRLPLLPVVPHKVLFWSKVDKNGPDGCWIWNGERKPAGYGHFGRNQTGRKMAHRHAYELLVGLIPPGLELDHLCRVTCCVNPEHLEPVTPAENRRREAEALRPLGVRRRRGWGPDRRKPEPITECRRNGHPFTPENTDLRANGKRRCRACRRVGEQ